MLCHFLIVWNEFYFRMFWQFACLISDESIHVCKHESIAHMKAKHTSIQKSRFCRPDVHFQWERLLSWMKLQKRNLHVLLPFQIAVCLPWKQKIFIFWQDFVINTACCYTNFFMPYETFCICKILIVIFANFSLFRSFCLGTQFEKDKERFSEILYMFC